ncbi:DUF1453 domain-containing protein [Dyella sp. A6]|uniref:DUF1453 domain-containing protein n=1 Tax=Dyella aluminiiresistens TaxID=3069105 RepID=UPI002E768D02|nr:DUF1453 domain-containing protein [Dyella sp. A6]
MSPHLMSYVVMVPLLVLIVWRRIGRQFGRQPIRRKRMIARVAVFAALGVLISLAGLHDVRLAEGLAGGVVLGGALGFVGLRLTRFEVDPVRGDCYVPNPWVGALLVALLLGRLAWRFMVLWPQMQQAGSLAAQTPGGAVAMEYQSSPLTLLVFGLLIGYYIVYFAGLLVHHRRFQRAQAG